MNIKTWIAAMAAAACGAVTAAGASPLDISYEEIPLEKIKAEDTLILSDSPEYARNYGILAEGTVLKGKGRIYYYHVNETGKPARLAVYGMSDKGEEIKVVRTLRGEPSRSYVPTGKTLSFREVTAKQQQPRNVMLEKGKRTILFEDNAKGIRQDDLVSGIVEVETSSPVRFGAAILPYEGCVEKHLEKARYLPPDSHEMRGTFPMHVYFESGVWDAEKNAGKIELGSAESTAFFQEGRDELNFIGRENTGNYGITCHLTIHSKGTGKYDLYLNPNGGVFEGTLEIGQDRRLLRIYRTERYGTRWFGHDTIYDYEKLGTWEAGKDLYIRFIPPGACYFPIRLLFVPKK